MNRADALTLDRNHTALVVIDVQDRLAATMKPDVIERTVKNTDILVQGMRALEGPILVTEQYPKGLGPTVEQLRNGLGEGIAGPFEKVEFDCTKADGFMAALRETGAETIILSGMEAHICVFQTAVGLLRQGKQVWVAQDAICSRTKENWRAALRLMQQAGANVAPTEAILFGLLEKAGTPEFKAVSKLIK